MSSSDPILPPDEENSSEEAPPLEGESITTGENTPNESSNSDETAMEGGETEEGEAGEDEVSEGEADEPETDGEDAVDLSGGEEIPVVAIAEDVDLEESDPEDTDPENTDPEDTNPEDTDPEEADLDIEGGIADSAAPEPDPAPEEVSEAIPEEPPALERVPPGIIRRSLAGVLRLVIKILNWLIVELEAEDIRQRPGAPNSIGKRLTITQTAQDELTPLRQIWRRVLLTVRAILPQKLQDVSDRNLGLIVATLVVVVGWTAVDGILPKPAPIPEQAIAQVPPEPPPVPTPEPEEEIPAAPQLPDVVEITPPLPPSTASEETEGEEAGETQAEELIDGDDGGSAAETELGDNLADNPDRPEQATPQEPLSSFEKPPALEMTPEQSLIAAIQDQVVDTAQQYGDSGIVRSIQADFRQGRLLVRIDSTPWFDLPATEQDQLAADLWARSLNLDFNKLEITTVEGVVLARSPVIGNTMVILQRQGTIL